MGMNILDPVVAVDRKAVNCDSCRSAVALQCQVAFSRWVKPLGGSISDCLAEYAVSLNRNNLLVKTCTVIITITWTPSAKC